MQDLNINEISYKETRFTVLDTETTGVSAANSRIMELGMVKVESGKILDTFSTFINPECNIPRQITAITGINNQHVAEAPVFEKLTSSILDFIGDSVLVAHNMQFDYAFMKAEFERAFVEFPEYNKLCTLKLSRKLFPELKSKALGAMVHHFGIRHKDVHRALGDAMATAKLLLKLFEKFDNELAITQTAEILKYQYKITAGSKRFSVKKTMADNFEKLPDSPGVYFYKNRKGNIIYIGKAKSLIKRVKNYFSTSAQSKSKKIIRQAENLGFVQTNTELTALIAEAELIKKHNPSLNSQLKRFSQSNFIKVTLDKEYPTLKSTAIFDFDGNDYFGPFTNRDASQVLIDASNKSFRLRECKEREFSRKKHCYLLDIDRCTAPCINNSTEEYLEELKNVYEFLSGNNQKAVDTLLKKMKFYSEQQMYEEAASIRNTVNTLLNQLNRSSILAEPINKAHVLIKVKGLPVNDFILLIEGKVFIKDYFVVEKSYFDEAIEDYFNGSIHLFNGIDKKDLEKMKILLAWICKNRSAVELYYLKDYATPQELAVATGWQKNKKGQNLHVNLA